MAASLARFGQDERGSMAVFMLLLFCFMLVFGGIAVDYMRYEIRRVAMQQTLDRAALAAASLTQAEDPQSIVDDYFEKARLVEGVSESQMAEFSNPVVTVVEGLNKESRSVRVEASVRSYNYFMNMFFMPVDYLEGPATTQAEQGSEQIEVMLVLDVTGSMDETPSGDTKKKIQGLKDAATLFVELTDETDTRNQMSIGIVPYNTQVNLGRALREQYNATNVPTFGGVTGAGIPNSNCIEVATTVTAFQNTEVPRTAPYPMSVFADLDSGTATGTNSFYVAWNNTSNAVPIPPTNSNAGSNYMCPPYAYSEVLLPTKEPDALIAKINSLQPNGRTSILMGMRWGVALIDETADDIYDALVVPNEAGMANRPAANADPKTRKIIILMTDGNHVATKFIRDGFKTGQSPIFRSNQDNNFSILLRPGNALPYWVPHLCTTSHNCAAGWRAQPWTNNANTGTHRQLDWSEVWQAVRPTWVARQLYARSNYTGAGVTNIYNAQLAAFRGDPYLNKATMDARLQTVCSAAKAEGIEVFGIAFGAGTDGENQIRGCASSGNPLDPNDKSDYFFKPQNAAQLEDTFKDIFSAISPLRLTE